MAKKPSESIDLSKVDSQMAVITDFLTEFYSKTVFQTKEGTRKDLSSTIIRFLYAFHQQEKAYPIGELAEIARIKRSTMTDIVDRMEKDGIAERIRDDADRRVVRVRLTPKGKKTKKEFGRNRRKELERLFAQLDPQDVKAFLKHMGKASLILKKINDVSHQ